MRLVFISDTHGLLSRLDLPEGDVLIHCGDATDLGSIGEFSKFKNDLFTVRKKYRKILYVPGNHDWLPARNPTLAKSILGSHITMLIDKQIVIDDTIFYGSPWQPKFMEWAFNINRFELKKKWQLIPNNTEILLTHTPAYGMLDKVGKRHVGCLDLTIRMMQLKKLKLHAFGHIHEWGGQIIENNILNVNASTLDEAYTNPRKPIVIDKIGDECRVLNTSVTKVEKEKLDIKQAREESLKITAYDETYSIKEWAEKLGYTTDSLRTLLYENDIEEIVDARNLRER